LRREWNALLATIDQPQVFYTYEWSLAVGRAYHASLNPLLFLAYDSNESLCGIVALAATPDDASVSFLCATTGDYCDFLSLPETKSAFVAGVLAELRKQGIRDVTLTNLPADSGTLAAIQDASRHSGYHCFARTAYVCAQVSLQKIERRPGPKNLALPGKEKLRRFLNAMGRETPVSLDHVRSWDAIKPLLPSFIQVHVARFLLTGRISNLVRHERRAFLAELAKLLGESGWITITRLAAGENTYAWNYGFQFQDTWFWYQPTFDSAIEKYSPGFCLLAKIIEEAAANPAFKVVDLGLGAEQYKDRFCNQSRRTLCVTLRVSASEHTREIVRYGAARMARALPPFETGFRASAMRLRRLNEQVGREGLIAMAARAPRRVRELLWFEEEVFFYEWCSTAPPESTTNKLMPLDANQLASGAVQYEDDAETLAYLLRSASRLRAGGQDGFGLVDPEGRFLHFGWTTVFEGFFLSELNAKVDAPSANSVMIFDCWTPSAVRGRGYYAEAVALIAGHLQEQGKAPWIFSAARNASSVQGLEKSGFRRRYSLTRQRALLWQRIRGETPKLVEAPATEVSARV
jgi:hypothetical protein